MSAEYRPLLFLGSGVVTGAWDPVITALREVGFSSLRTADSANLAMARLVYVTRLAELRWHKGPEVENKELVRKILEDAKHTICKTLAAAQAAGDLSVRPEFREILTTFVLPGARQVALVTTNWDTVADHAARAVHPKLSVRHVHGTIDDSGGIYLPTEIVEDYRDEAKRKLLSNARAGLVRALDKTTRLILYGVALSPLDIELGQLIATGLHEGAITEIYVIDPAYPNVAARLATLTEDLPPVPVRCYHPGDLRREWLFSPDDVVEETERLREIWQSRSRSG